MKKLILFLIITLSCNAGMFGDTEEEKRNAQEKLRLAMTLQQNPKIKKIKNENKYYKKILKEHKINYKIIIEQKKKANKINNIKNYFLVTEEKEIKTLEQINKELLRLLNVNYIKYKKQNRNYKTGIEKFKETFHKTTGIKLPTPKINNPKKKVNYTKLNRKKAKEELKKEMEEAILEVN